MTVGVYIPSGIIVQLEEGDCQEFHVLGYGEHLWREKSRIQRLVTGAMRMYVLRSGI